MPIIIPPQSLLDAFDHVTRPIFDLLFNLALQIPTLRTARDLLVLKLISRELDISTAELKMEAAAE